MRQFGIALALIVISTFAQAEIQDAEFQEALAAVRQYGDDMTTVMPCIYGGAYNPASSVDTTELDWGMPAVTKTVNLLRKEGASDEQVGALLQAFEDNFKPDWAVPDIRKYWASCYLIYNDAYRLNSKARPLLARGPFMKYWGAK
jgi:hypothetical protein